MNDNNIQQSSEIDPITIERLQRRCEVYSHIYTFNRCSKQAKKLHSFNLVPHEKAIQNACREAELFMLEYGKGRQSYLIDHSKYL